jgi:hypothetical protein
MACSRCAQRRDAISKGVSAAVRGDVKAVASAGAFVGRTLAQDARSGALRTAAAANLASLRASLTRRR